jgi:hypothetical protein
MTTVIRSLHFVMAAGVEGKKLRVIPDSEAIILFLHFYKLIFLGTRFTEKVFQIKIAQKPQAQSKGLVDSCCLSEGEERKEGELGSDSFIIDTSEISSDGGAFSDNFGHG